MGKDICVQGPSPPSSLGGILAFSKNLHFKNSVMDVCGLQFQVIS